MGSIAFGTNPGGKIMRDSRGSACAFIILLLLSGSNFIAVQGLNKPFNVSYDHRAVIIDGQRRMLISAGIHYPRATPEMWPHLLSMSKEGGADVIQTYTFWNGHEPVRGQYNFAGRYDLVKFVKLVQNAGLYLHLRIGPYVCAEWNFGGFPVWLRDIPGIEFRTDNMAFKEEMEKYVTMIVNLMKVHKLFSCQGGPIILLQIENEYGNVEHSFGEKGKRYVKWAASMAEGLDAGVPWIMCQQSDAPGNIINSCNGFYCDGFKPNAYHKPTLWTEDWNGWFSAWGGRVPRRPVEDNAFAVARFFQRGGSFHNYYMYFGGTNFGRTAGGPFYTTSYDYDAPIDEYGMLRQPKWGHLKDLHAAIKLCEPALISVDGDPQYIRLGPQQEAHVYKYSGESKVANMTVIRKTEKCAAFLANIDSHSSATVHFNGKVFHLPPWSVSILPDCKNVVFNTAKVGSQTSIVSMKRRPALSQGIFDSEILELGVKVSQLSKVWSEYKEPIGLWGEGNFSAKGILEHLNVTKDSTDYLWYTTSINISEADSAFWLVHNKYPSLVIDAVRDVVCIFVNGQIAGSSSGYWVRVEQPLNLSIGYNEIAILSEMIGLQNYGAFLEKDGGGLRGSVTLQGLVSGDRNLTMASWGYQVGLKGEYLEIYSPEQQDGVEWSEIREEPQKSPFTWYKTVFDAPDGDNPVTLDLGSMGKGQVWVNGKSLGRHWPSYLAPETGCNAVCDYRGAYNQDKCTSNCGKPTQRWYHIPRAWLQEINNLLVVFEESGGNPLEISADVRVTQTICAEVSQSHPPPIRVWPDLINMTAGGGGYVNMYELTIPSPEVHLQCDDGQEIVSITFASFGNPEGHCGRYVQGTCHADTSHSVVIQACQGKKSCLIPVSTKIFGGDPCPGTTEKRLAIEANCMIVSTAPDSILQSY